MITLKRITPKDIGYFFHLANNKDVRSFMESEEPYTQDHFAVLVDNKATQWYTINDDSLKDDTRVGLFTSYAKEDRLYVGVIVDENHRRKGYARQAFKTFLEITDKIGADVHLCCFKDQPALPMYKELGFKELKDERSRVRGKMWIQMKREKK